MHIAIVGKYNGLGDSYLSLTKALTHSAIHLNVDVSIQWIDATDLEPETKYVYFMYVCVYVCTCMYVRMYVSNSTTTRP